MNKIHENLQAVLAEESAEIKQLKSEFEKLNLQTLKTRLKLNSIVLTQPHLFIVKTQPAKAVLLEFFKTANPIKSNGILVSTQVLESIELSKALSEIIKVNEFKGEELLAFQTSRDDILYSALTLNLIPSNVETVDASAVENLLLYTNPLNTLVMSGLDEDSNQVVYDRLRKIPTIAQIGCFFILSRLYVDYVDKYQSNQNSPIKLAKNFLIHFNLYRHLLGLSTFEQLLEENEFDYESLTSQLKGYLLQYNIFDFKFGPNRIELDASLKTRDKSINSLSDFKIRNIMQQEFEKKVLMQIQLFSDSLKVYLAHNAIPTERKDLMEKAIFLTAELDKND